MSITLEEQGTSKVATVLDPELWRKANRHVVAKAIAEFAHEDLFTPLASGPLSAPSDRAEYVLESPAGDRYHFTARKRELDHWDIDEESLNRFLDGSAPQDAGNGVGGGAGSRTEPGTVAEGEDVELPVDALEFILDFAPIIELKREQLPVYLEEISSTLLSYCYKHRLGASETVSSRDLAAGQGIEAFQLIERSMTEGHPCFVANNGRLGYGSEDYLAYAPETGAPVRLVWLAVRRDAAQFSSIETLDYAALIERELSESERAAFNAILEEQGLKLEDYYFIPAHPWQWDNKLQISFAAEIAERRMVYLGLSGDTFQAQQSIRTFFNRENLSRAYVKTAISVLNMGFMRGLSSEYMRGTPAINDWLSELVESDPFFASRKFHVLREIAAVGYHNRYFERASDKSSAYRKMFAALWRESPAEKISSDETLSTMAALLHRDAEGISMVSALIERSQLSPQEWLCHYLRAYLQPLLHALLNYELVFMPHGENVILVLKNGVPERIFMKDIAEEIALMNTDITLSSEVERIRFDIPENQRALAIFTDVFDCFFRFLATIFADDSLLTEEEFWGEVAASVNEYLESVPARYAKDYDLFCATFPKSCLNRLQLRNNAQMLDLVEQAEGLVFSGELTNPIARFKK